MITEHKIIEKTNLEVANKFDNVNYERSYYKILRIGFWLFGIFSLVGITLLIIFSFTSGVAFAIIVALGSISILVAIISSLITSIIATNKINTQFKKELQEQFFQIILSIINSFEDYQLFKTEQDFKYILKYKQSEASIIIENKKAYIVDKKQKSELNIDMFINQITWKYKECVIKKATFKNALIQLISTKISDIIIANFKIIDDFFLKEENGNI